MPTTSDPTIRLTLNLDETLSEKINALARALHLKRAVCARMLIVEALAVRELYPKIPQPPGFTPPRGLKPRR